MIPLEQARSIVLAAVQRGPTEPVDLARAVGRVLAHPVVAPWSWPPYDNAALDGFAVRHADLGETPLAVRGTAYAGEDTPEVPAGAAVRITTGARMPPQLDTVVPQERARVEGETVQFEPGALPGANVRRAGEDVGAGDELAASGTVVGPALIGALAAFGQVRTQVVGRPRVNVLTLGDELVPPVQASATQVADANGPALVALADAAGGVARQVGLAPDDPEQLRASLRTALDDCDFLLTVGGASVGDRDHVRTLLRELGVEFRFAGVELRPGKPVAFGLLGDQLVFALPGNPLATAVTFHCLVRPALLRWLGRPVPKARRAALTTAIEKRAGFVELVPARLLDESGTLLAELAPRRGSGSITAALGCDGYAVLQADRDRLEAGELVDVEPF